MPSLTSHRPLLDSFYAGDVPAAIPEGLAAALAAGCDAARREWPDLAVTDDVFCRYLGERVTADELLDGSNAVLVSDLYVACACAMGTPAASPALVEHCRGAVSAAIARVLDPADRDEATQRVWTSLLVADEGGRPKIAGYKGRGPLQAFVRISAIRVALSLRRRTGQAVAAEVELDKLADDTDDPELRYLKQLYRDEFRRSFAVALAGLSGHQQLLLKLDIVDRLTIDEAAVVYGRSRSTTARHLLEARQELARGTLADLQARLNLPPSELRSVARLVRSEIDLSVERLLVAP